MQPSDEIRDDELRGHRLTPRQHADDRQAHREVQQAHDDDGDKNRPRNRRRRAHDFPADAADGVVAEVVVRRIQSGAAEPEPETARQLPRPRWKHDDGARAVRRAVDDNPRADAERQHAERHAPPPDRVDAPVDERRRDGTGGHRQRLGLPHRHRGSEEARIVREADRARRNHERHAGDRLPQIEEAEEASRSVWSVRLEQILIAAAGSRHRRAELGPHQAVGKRDDRADEPSQHRLRPAHRREQQRDRHEGADADHGQHVDGRGAADA